MPLNAIPPTTTIAGLTEKVKAAQGQCWVDVGFYGGIIPGNHGELKALVEAGVRGFKGFLIESGARALTRLQVDEFPAVSATDIQRAMAELADQPTTLMFHAEMIPPISDSVGDDVQISLPPLAPTGPLDVYSTFLASRPSSFETYAIAEILSLAHLAPKLPLHIVHLSAMEAVPLLRKARAQGIKVTAETCPHYLSLTAEGVARGDTRHKCCPPIRTQSNQDALWSELLQYSTSGVIQTVVSDHSPCTPDLKLLPSHVFGSSSSCSPSSSSSSVPFTLPRDNQDNDNSPESLPEIGDFFSAWGGISSVGLSLPILWTELSRRNLTSPSSDRAITDVVRWCCINTAAQIGLEFVKGDLAVGFDGDLCVFDDEAEWTVEPSTMLFRNKCSPYQGRRMRGMVRETWVRGRKVFERNGENGGFGAGAKAGGRLLLEKRQKRQASV
ncbi:MAG: hypothetical protein Q9160_001170 [Pyrenula sp. 1 TL-2023]